MIPSIIPEGRTPRLLLRPFSLEDAPQIQRLFPQWEIVKYLNAKIPWPYPPDGADQFLRNSALPQMAAAEAWHWTIRLLTGPTQIIGAISLVAGEDENRGFWLLPQFRGQGLMTEACIWVNDFWFDTLGRPILRAPKAVANHGSRSISERMGMRVLRIEERDFISGRLPSEIWEITAEEWRAWKLLHPGGIAPKPRSAPASRKSPPGAKKRTSPATKPL